jgi:NAD(P)H-hydrate epimerase
MKPPADKLLEAIYSRAQVRELDRIAIEEHGIAGYELMTRAGQAALTELMARWPDTLELLVYCGAGNNAGDGYVVARLARARGLSVRVAAVVAPERLHGDAAQAWQDCRAAGVPIDAYAPGSVAAAPDLIVDALLGTGLDRELGGAVADAVAEINRAPQPVVALDIPTGLDADSGLVLGDAVAASLTVTFVGLKQGLFLGQAADYCGELVFADLGVPAPAADALQPVMRRITAAELAAALPRRARTAHKGANGRLLLVGGGPGMSGAIRIAGEAALRSGAGLVYVATHPGSVGAVMAGRPELMCRPVETPAELDELIGMADAVVLGPGLGRSDWARALFERAIGIEQPLIADADALNLIAESGQPPARGNWVVTPHPGEAARLLGSDAGAIQRDRLGSARALAERLGAAAVLKGAGSLVAAREANGAVEVAVCDRGNPGMATGGMGDLLSGVVGALLAQGLAPAPAARAAVLLHALAGDDAAAAGGERGMLASDLLDYIRRRANPV